MDINQAVEELVTLCMSVCRRDINDHNRLCDLWAVVHKFMDLDYRFCAGELPDRWIYGGMTKEQVRELAAWVNGQRAAIIIERDTIVDKGSNMWVMFDNAQKQWNVIQQWLAEHKLG